MPKRNHHKKKIGLTYWQLYFFTYLAHFQDNWRIKVHSTLHFLNLSKVPTKVKLKIPNAKISKKKLYAVKVHGILHYLVVVPVLADGNCGGGWSKCQHYCSTRHRRNNQLPINDIYTKHPNLNYHQDNLILN